MKLVQMPTDLLHVEDDALSAVIEPGLLAEFRAYLHHAAEDTRGVAILAPPAASTRDMLMVLARRIGATLRDENIRLRERGGDLKTGRRKLCYLPGSELAAALDSSGCRRTLASEAACFVQDVDGAWGDEQNRRVPLTVSALIGLLDTRLAGGLPTFLSAAPDQLPDGLERDLRARLLIIEPA